MDIQFDRAVGFVAAVAFSGDELFRRIVFRLNSEYVDSDQVRQVVHQRHCINHII